MEVVAPTTTRKRKQAKVAYVPKAYANPAIPYAVSQPKRFWRIKKDLPAATYWQKRYWRRRITGRGDYTMNPSHSYGQQWGGYLGSRAGEFLGGAAQTMLTGLVTGMGDYSVKRNIFMSGRLPEIVNQPTGGGTIIRFQEYLGDVFTSSVAGAFDIQSYLLNAANSDTFPFLSQVACNYEQYEIEGLLFSFKSTSANALNSVNTALGSVMMATQYDILDAPFASKLEMLNYEFSTSAKPSTDTVHMIECEPRQSTISNLYTLDKGQIAPPNADPRMYHLGKFSIATTGFQGVSVNIGQLHVTYQIRLLKPKLYATLGLSNLAFRYECTDGPTTSAYTDLDPLGTELVQSTTATFQSPPCGVTLIANNIHLPYTTREVIYQIQINWLGNPATPVAAVEPIKTLSGCIFLKLTDNEPQPNPVSAMSTVFYIRIIPFAADPFIQIGNAGTLPHGPGRGINISVIEVPRSQMF